MSLYAVTKPSSWLMPLKQISTSCTLGEDLCAGSSSFIELPFEAIAKVATSHSQLFGSEI